ncbi:MAG TPA: phasin family protein [Xanthomonadales bacterium]|nr:phasin family protein [Xanthomonadales bacterium]
MYEQIDTKQFIAYGKQFSDAAFKAHGLAIAGFERAVDVQLKTLENRFNAAVDFWTGASEVRDLESAKTLFPKSVQIARDNAETLYAASQELVGITVKTTEAIGDVVRGQYEQVSKTAAPAAKKTRK